MASDGVRLEEMQAAIARVGARWEAGTTPLTEVPGDDLQLFLGYVPGPNEPSLPEREQAALSNLTSPSAMAVPAGVDVPSGYDLRNVDGRNFVTSIRDQGHCGSSVAFATVAAVEGTLMVALDAPALDAANLSEAHLFYCHARREGRRCNNGWWVEPALRAVRNNGIVDEGCYPYVVGDQDCSNLCANAALRRTFINSWRRYVTAASMKMWISGTGPLIACFSVYEDFLAYRRGVYRHVSGDFLGGHCVCVVGYEDDEQSWICKNSWGTGFGESGFFRIEYGQCGIDAEMWAVEGVRPASALRR